MDNFTFHNPTRLHFGRGQIAQLGRELPPQARVLLVYGGGSIRRNGVYDQVRGALEGRTVVEFAGIEPNPEYETLLRAALLGRQERVDWVLAVGGGSVIDGGKFIAAAVTLDPAIDPWLIVGNRTPLKTALPLGCVLTLPATGSESNFAAVVNRRQTQDKLSFKNPLVFPRFSVLDPQVTVSLPPRQIGNGIVDAFVHTVEQYLTVPTEARVQDRLAEGILQTLIEVGPQTLADPAQHEARANMMWAANQALFGLVGLGQVQDWATHAIGHELTALYGLDHAQTLAAILPALLRYRYDDKRAKLIQYGRRVWQLSGGEDEIAQRAIAATTDFFGQIGVATNLGAYGIDADAAAQAVAAQLIRHGRLRLGEYGRLAPDDCAAIVRMAG
ncbi:iron-containing alcohol dehydrogenase [Chitiniphilus purpureus]|uniref:Iron-containing alcohol dehydrogenase n=1 Tax=Chitiniphilus purpureus TaxID=2981137 RepID=A0ABY6DU78_9NEIS|nr:iron-containing alcohol dehydrogenase [Chitiniphilus sp. CD1]UXY15418.1 iron-containing alcohol dehydrogenase [Chitiniphilus sp. CD1]